MKKLVASIVGLVLALSLHAGTIGVYRGTASGEELGGNSYAKVKEGVYVVVDWEELGDGNVLVRYSVISFNKATGTYLRTDFNDGVGFVGPGHDQAPFLTLLNLQGDKADYLAAVLTEMMDVDSWMVLLHQGALGSKLIKVGRDSQGQTLFANIPKALAGAFLEKDANGGDPLVSSLTYKLKLDSARTNGANDYTKQVGGVPITNAQLFEQAVDAIVDSLNGKFNPEPVD